MSTSIKCGIYIEDITLHQANITLNSLYEICDVSSILIDIYGQITRNHTYK